MYKSKIELEVIGKGEGNVKGKVKAELHNKDYYKYYVSGYLSRKIRQVSKIDKEGKYAD